MPLCAFGALGKFITFNSTGRPFNNVQTDSSLWMDPAAQVIMQVCIAAVSGKHGMAHLFARAADSYYQDVIRVQAGLAYVAFAGILNALDGLMVIFILISFFRILLVIHRSRKQNRGINENY